MTLFCFWVFLSLKRFPRLIFSLILSNRNRPFPQSLWGISLYCCSAQNPLPSVPLCDIEVGPCKHASQTRWHAAKFVSRGHWRDPAGNRLCVLVCVLFSCSSCGAAAVLLHAERSVVLTVQLFLLAPWQAVSCSAVMTHGFLLASLSLLALLWEMTCLPISAHKL